MKLALINSLTIFIFSIVTPGIGQGDAKPSFNKNKKATQFTMEKKADQFAVETVKADTTCNTEQELQFALECKEPFYDAYPIAFT